MSSRYGIARLFRSSYDFSSKPLWSVSLQKSVSSALPLVQPCSSTTTAHYSGIAGSSRTTWSIFVSVLTKALGGRGPPGWEVCPELQALSNSLQLASI